MKDSELLLQELNAVIRNLLLHFYVEMRVEKCFIASQLLSKLVAEFFPHGLWYKRNIDQLFWEDALLLKFELKSHIVFDLSLKLWL